MLGGWRDIRRNEKWKLEGEVACLPAGVVPDALVGGGALPPDRWRVSTKQLNHSTPCRLHSDHRLISRGATENCEGRKRCCEKRKEEDERREVMRHLA